MIITSLPTFIILLISFLATLILIVLISKKIEKSQLRTSFLFSLISLMICDIGLLFQISLSQKLKINPIYFDYFVYIGTCFLPVGLFFTGNIFAKTKITFKKYDFLFIIPVFSLILLWTNDIHHLFYIDYYIDINKTVFGPYFLFHSIYSYGLLFLGLLQLIKFSIKNAGFFSKQSILLILGTLIPIIVNLLGSLKIIPMTIYVTPISFTIAIIFFAIAIFKFNFLSISPIALQKVVDRMSDGYIVVNEDSKIIDFNTTFLTMSKLKSSFIRNINIYDLIKMFHNMSIDAKKVKLALDSVKTSTKTISYEKHFNKLNKHFHIEFSSLNNKNSFIGTLILFKDITQHIEDMEKIKDAQETLMETERLSSLGQLIGGIAHNLKTPIMSIAGAAEGLTDLIKEYDSSIEDPEVNFQDHHDIANDMSKWIVKIKEYTEYMSDIITAVKGQAVTLSETENVSFDLDELVKRVDILMKHELKSAIVYLDIQMKTNKNTVINGDVNSLVQVINNMISNAIQSYNGEPEQKIDLIIAKNKNNLIISVKDYGQGLPSKVKDKLFKEMITTKGKNGTGLGLYMSYSTIKAHFNGDITFESEEGKGTLFNIILPL